MTESIAALGERIREALDRIVVGQRDAVFELTVGWLAGGHVLLEGVPGLAKTLLSRAFAHVLGLGYRRIQFTPDLMPADVVGTQVLDPRTGTFHLSRGPVFTDFLLADEINRTPPKTQAALLEAMEERQVTLDGERHPLSDAFFVVATQNQVELEGTYPLPEAQVDRFLLQIVLGYPSLEEEVAMLSSRRSSGSPTDFAELGIRPVVARDDIAGVHAAVSAVRCEPTLVEYVARLARATRASSRVALGASPRAAIALLWCARAVAGLAGRDYVIPDDVKRMAEPVLRHRLVLRPEAQIEGATVASVIHEILEAVPVPR
ncbi:MAG: MoxR family ATPase [Deltaproteobacteria bacterium]|nr:MoxR family ATPase [Deltaproteobacteria bacterium]